MRDCTVSWGMAMSKDLRSESRSDLVTQWYNSVDVWGQSWGNDMGWLGGTQGRGGDWSKGGVTGIDWAQHTRTYYILHQVCHTSHSSFLYSDCRKGGNVLTACTSRGWLDLHKELCTIRELLRVNMWSADYPHNFYITSDSALWCQSTSGQTPNQIYSHTYFKYSVHTKVTNITTWWPHIFTHQRLCWDSNWMRQISS